MARTRRPGDVASMNREHDSLYHTNMRTGVYFLVSRVARVTCTRTCASLYLAICTFPPSSSPRSLPALFSLSSRRPSSGTRDELHCKGCVKGASRFYRCVESPWEICDYAIRVAVLKARGCKTARLGRCEFHRDELAIYAALKRRAPLKAPHHSFQIFIIAGRERCPQ